MGNVVDAVMGLSPVIRAVLFVVLVVQLGLQIYALVDLARRDRVVGGKKWLWAVIAIVGGVLGAAIYLVVGRRPATADQSSLAGGHQARDRALDRLYGKSDQP